MAMLQLMVQDGELTEYRAYVTGGVLHCYGRELPLPFLRGSGTFRIQYLGRSLRIFENPGSALAVQVSSLLQSAARMQSAVPVPDPSALVLPAYSGALQGGSQQVTLLSAIQVKQDLLDRTVRDD